MEMRNGAGSGPADLSTTEMDRTPLTVLVVLAVVAAAQFVHYYGLVPDTLVTHFDMAGHPNGWTDKAGFVTTMAIIEGLFVIGAFLFVRYGARIPADAMNIPNRDYWLQPERRDDTLRFVWSRILWIETVTLAFLIAVTETVFRANMTQGTPSLSSNFFYVLVAFVVVIGWMAISILVRFRRHGQG